MVFRCTCCNELVCEKPQLLKSLLPFVLVPCNSGDFTRESCGGIHNMLKWQSVKPPGKKEVLK